MADQISERQLLSKLEKGQTEDLKGFFNGRFEEERIGAVDRMHTQYLDDVAQGKVKSGTLGFETKQWFGQDIDIKYKGKNVYHDTFDIANLKHSDPNDVVPANRVEFDPKSIAQVTKNLEAGSPMTLAMATHGMKAEEVQRYLGAVVAQNQLDIKNHDTNIGLAVYNGWNKNPNMMIELNRYADAWKNRWSNPQPVYTMTVDTKSGHQIVSSQPDNRA